MQADAPVLTVDTVCAALHEVIDPELGFNIVDLGLVYDVAVDGGIVDVRLTMTTAGCPAQDYIVGGVERCLAQVQDVTGVFVEVVWNPPWSPDRMSPAAKAHFRISDDGPRT